MSTTTRQQDTSHEETHSGTRRGGRALRRPWADLWRKIQGRRSSLYASRHRFARPLQRRPKNIQNWLCILLVFVAGAAALAIEMAASRLLAPYFGSSLFVWANLIGLILLYLTIGYYIGGRLADRRPYPQVFYSITLVAALLIGAIPLIAHPILTWALNTFATYSLGSFYGPFVSVILLFALPTSLLGCVSPYAIRLSIDQLGRTGRVAGKLYAVSTAGSIVGTFVPVLILLPDIGTNFTFISSAALLLLISIFALIVTNFTAQKK